MEWAIHTISRYFLFVAVLGRVPRFFVDVTASIFTPKFYVAAMFEQMQRICIHCMIPILFVLAPMGAVVAMEGLKVGATTMTSSLLSVALKELQQLSERLHTTLDHVDNFFVEDVPDIKDILEERGIKTRVRVW